MKDIIDLGVKLLFLSIHNIKFSKNMWGDIDGCDEYGSCLIYFNTKFAKLTYWDGLVEALDIYMPNLPTQTKHKIVKMWFSKRTGISPSEIKSAKVS